MSLARLLSSKGDQFNSYHGFKGQLLQLTIDTNKFYI